MIFFAPVIFEQIIPETEENFIVELFLSILKSIEAIILQLIL